MVVIPEGHLAFGESLDSCAGPQATLVVKNDAFWARLALFTDLGLAEGYMIGEGK